MKKGALVETVRGILLQSEAVDDNVKVLHYKRVEAVVDAAFAELMQVLAKKDSADVESNYVKKYYSQPVVSASGTQYVVLTDSVVSLPEAKGLWFCKPAGSKITYPRTTSTSRSLFSSLPMGQYVDDTWVRLGNAPSGSMAIIFEHVGNSTRRSIKSVDYGLVRAPSSYGDDEDIHLPSDSFSFVIEKCLSWLGRRKNDTVNQGQ